MQRGGEALSLRFRPHAAVWAATAGERAAVDVVMRTRDRPRFLARACRGLAAQTFRPIHAIVVNDGGDLDAVRAIVDRELAGSGVTSEIVHLATAVGAAAAINPGVAAGRRKYFVIHDDDNTWDPAFLAETTAVLDSPDGLAYGAALSHGDQIVEEVTATGIRTIEARPYWRLPAVSLFHVLSQYDNPLINGLLCRRALLDAIGPFDDRLLTNDWEFIARVLIAGEIAVVPKVLAFWHVRTGVGPGDPDANATQSLGAQYPVDRTVHFNQLLRDEIAAGRIGFGLLAHLSSGEIGLARQLVRLQASVDALAGRLDALAAPRASPLQRFLHRLGLRRLPPSP
ncbi:MAG: glycosyltransferase family 2 protein [Alphaproteobacteria bacterium]|nr:glycosyltransferase family 2 protein [Alphaproteobacteria bacterium]